MKNKVEKKNVAKKNATIVFKEGLDNLKDLKFKSGKTEEIQKVKFKLSF